MAFVKNQVFSFENSQHSSGAIDGVVDIPMVVTNEGTSFHGFVPGFVMKDIIQDDKNVCMQKLQDFVKLTVKNMIKDKKLFPFFPDNEQIKKDFKNVVIIKRVKVKINY